MIEKATFTIFALGLIAGLEKRTLPITIIILIFAFSLDLLNISNPYATYLAIDIQTGLFTFLFGYFLGYFGKKMLILSGKGVYKGLKLIGRGLKELKLEEKIEKGLKSLTKKEWKLIKKEEKFVKTIRKLINSSIKWLEKGSTRKSLENVRKAENVVDEAINIVKNLTNIEKREDLELREEEKIEQEELNEERQEDIVLRNIGLFFNQIEKKEENVNIQEERIENVLEQLERLEMRDLANLYKDLINLKGLLNNLYKYIIAFSKNRAYLYYIQQILLQIKSLLDKIEKEEYLLLQYVRKEESFEKRLDKLLAKESKLEKMKIKLLKRAEKVKLPRI